ncbi:MAG TPA: hypothetical protein VGM53_03130 [Streptosporangiaceae bacterium]
MLVTIANAATSHTAGTDRAFAVAGLLMAAGAVIGAILLRQPPGRQQPHS